MQTKTISFSVGTLSLKDIHKIRHRSINDLQEDIRTAGKAETVQELEELAVAIITLLGKEQGAK